MTTVCIIGAGELGGAVAHALARGGRVDRVMIVDQAAGVAAGKALDIQQAGAIEAGRVRLEGTTDPAVAADAAVCVIADRSGSSPAEWQSEGGLQMLSRLVPRLVHAPIVFAGATQAGLLLDANRDLRLPREHLIGSAPEAMVGAVTAIVADEAQCPATAIALAVLGAPPAFVVPWSHASIGGYALEQCLSPGQLSRIESRVSRRWPLGPHALAQGAACVVHGLLAASRRTFSVLTVLGGEFGTRNRVGVLPVTLSPRGIAGAREPVLDPRERVRVGNALAV